MQPLDPARSISRTAPSCALPAAPPTLAVSPSPELAPKGPCDGITVADPAPASASTSTSRSSKRFFVEGADGFVAYDPASGKALRGRPPGARLRRRAPAPGPLRALSHVVARGVAGEQLSFQSGHHALDAAAPTERSGEQRLSLDTLDGLGREREHLLTLDVRHEGASPSQARVLALPADYDGPIFVSDIDDTLRATKVGALLRGEVQPPLPGARELLEGVAGQGVPIVYLSAAPAQMHSVNQAFLAQLPPGILLDHPHYTAENLIPNGAHQAEVQGDYKSDVLADLRHAFPHARLYQLGDNRYGDARAYNDNGASYIHNVRPDQAFVPEGFSGVLADHYHPEFRARVLSDLTEAVKTSAHLGGSPTRSLTPGPAHVNPAPIARQSLLDRMRHAVRTFAPQVEGGVRGLTQRLLQQVEMRRAPLDVARGLSDADLAALPPRSLGVLADQLLDDLVEKRCASVDEACDVSAQFVRVLVARGADRGSIDYILSKVEARGQLPDALVGPARLTCAAHLQGAPTQAGDWAGFHRYLDRATATRATAGNAVEPLIDGARAFPAMLADIDAARSSVNFCVFDFQSDEAGWEYARHLASASERGCDVRFIYDPGGSHTSNGMPTDPAIFDFLRDRGVQVIAQKPDLLPNHMMHRKIVVVDGAVGYVGGMNVGDEYRDVWRDVHCRLIGPAVGDLQALYLEQWADNGGEVSEAALRTMFPAPEKSDTTATTRIIGHEGRQDVAIRLSYLRAIDTAAESIQIATPYLTDPEIVSHLCDAARRGVKVQVVVPQTNIHAFVQAAERSYHEDMRAAGIEIYGYEGRPMLHAKVATFDHRVSTIGSSNLDAQSLVANDEVNLWSSDEALCGRLETEFFAPTITDSEPLRTSASGRVGRLVERALAKAHPML